MDILDIVVVGCLVIRASPEDLVIVGIAVFPDIVAIADRDCQVIQVLVEQD